MKKLLSITLILLTFSIFSQEQKSQFKLDLFNGSNIDKVGFINVLNSNNKNYNANKPSVLIQKLDSVKVWDFSPTSNLFNINLSKSFNYIYDANNNLTSNMGCYWNTTTSTWDNNCQSATYAYDANNNKISNLAQLWNTTTSTLVNNSKQTFTYDSNNNQTSFLPQTWNATTSTWNNTDKWTYAYDANNNKISHLAQQWNATTSTWDSIDKWVYTYDSNNNRISDLRQQWNTTTSTWRNNKKYSYTYDANNNETSDLEENWNSTTSTWYNLIKRTSTYDANNNLTSYTSLGWNATTLTWDNGGGRVFYGYDANNNQISMLQQQLNTTTSTWNNTNEFINTFDFNNFQKSKALFYYANGTRIGADSTYYYFHTVVGINELEKSNLFSIYPNPSKGIFNIKTETAITSIEVYNNIGILVSKLELKSNSQINLSSLSKGLYFLKVSNGKQYHTEKIIIE